MIPALTKKNIVMFNGNEAATGATTTSSSSASSSSSAAAAIAASPVVLLASPAKNPSVPVIHTFSTSPRASVKPLTIATSTSSTAPAVSLFPFPLTAAVTAAGLNGAVKVPLTMTAGSSATTTSAKTVLEIPGQENFESILQGHRRKMLRRAANRKSAQLSRARKKAQLEELKVENNRLMRIMDIVDSVPDLVFSMTSNGRITYTSDRIHSFIKLEENDDEPVHITQILSESSAKDVLCGIMKLKEKEDSSDRHELDSSMMFFTQSVFLSDMMGNQVTGRLRCAKVQKRASLSDMQNQQESMEVHGSVSREPVTSITQKSSGPPQKKPRKSNHSPNILTPLGLQNVAPVAILPSGEVVPVIPIIPVPVTAPTAPSSASKPADSKVLDMSKFNMLADCVSSIAESEQKVEKKEATEPSSNPANCAETGKDVDSSKSSKSGYSSGNISSLSSNSGGSTTNDDEYVCVIRIIENQFAMVSVKPEESESIGPDLQLFVTSPLLSSAKLTQTSGSHDSHG